jgi:hypothetical protein
MMGRAIPAPTARCCSAFYVPPVGADLFFASHLPVVNVLVNVPAPISHRCTQDLNKKEVQKDIAAFLIAHFSVELGNMSITELRTSVTIPCAGPVSPTRSFTIRACYAICTGSH